MKYALLGLIFLFVGCQSAPKKTAPVTPPPLAPVPSTSPYEDVDYVALRTFLQMDRDRESLGLMEKAFNTCETGFGYSRSQNCRTEHLLVLNFRLLCRFSEGTISQILTDADLRPLERRSVKWNLKGLSGVAYTDSDGYGSIIATSRFPQKFQRVRLAIGPEFLYMRAGELQKVITPRPWCDQY